MVTTNNEESDAHPLIQIAGNGSTRLKPIVTTIQINDDKSKNVEKSKSIRSKIETLPKKCSASGTVNTPAPKSLPIVPDFIAISQPETLFYRRPQKQSNKLGRWSYRHSPKIYRWRETEKASEKKFGQIVRTLSYENRTLP